ncbi:lamin tail domain-containing protein [Pedosphaera parvula]|uniref:LTD domain-containing protein n=1 Tax=Pedosphaera parvula (strain Ellin514) TaxID=320771 RepID=B9XQP2_PEDPL|nr:lamin tail domain-containing protein [Pedosphaera parvula]EEF57824.1 hypothetical protein Cflav_PD0806 [Pedosphaera parvula Ellin514]
MGNNFLGTGFQKWLRGVAVCLGLGLCAGQAFQITSTDFAGGGHFRMEHEANTNSYYILYRGTTLTNIDTPVSMALGVGVTGQLVDTNVNLMLSNEMAFYRVLEVPLTDPMDMDGDLIDDAYELMHAPCLNPLDPTDALADCSGSGHTNLQVYLSQFNGLLINEVDYDSVGTDTGEFVEIYNGSTNTISMTGLALVFINGANNLEYRRVKLTGALTPGQYLVVADNAVTVAAGAAVIRFAGVQDNIQNGAPDGIALFHVISHTVLDSLAYEGGMTAALIDGAPGTYNFVDGTALSASVADSNTVAGSLARLPNGGDLHNDSVDWQFSSTPTPGAANVP